MDLVYTVSCQKDFERDVSRIKNTSSSSHYQTADMFNEMGQMGSGTNLKMSLLKGPIRGFQVSKTEDHTNNKLNGDSLMSTAEFIGRYRFKYFACPVLKTTTTNSKHLEPITTINETPRTNFRSEVIPPTPPIQSRETQTDYRDSETQTDPYSPPFFLKPGSDTEILLLRNLTWGNGLPAGRMEVDMILKARMRRKGEKEKTNVNRNKMESWESVLETSNVDAEKWLYRNKVEEECRHNKLQLLSKSLNDLRDKHGDLIEERLRTLWKRRYREKERKEFKLKAEQERDLRRLCTKKNIATDRNNSSKGMQFNDDLLPNINAKVTDQIRKYSSCFLQSDILSMKRHQSEEMFKSGISGRKNKFERDLEEAYRMILEKKKLLPNIQQTNFISNQNVITMKRDTPTQTDFETGFSRTKPHTENQNGENSELDTLLTQLMSDHWESINQYFHDLLLEVD